MVVLIDPKPARDDGFLAYVREQSCARCHRYPTEYFRIDAAHTGPRAYGRKASDYSCIPLCADCHLTGQMSYHNTPGGETAWLQQQGWTLLDLLEIHLNLYLQYRRRYPKRRPPELPLRMQTLSERLKLTRESSAEFPAGTIAQA